MAASIGTYGERALHAALKRLIEPDESLHERPYHGCVVDVLRPDGVFEVQTRAFDRLRGKLGRLLPDTAVTVVYPAVRQKWLVWVDPDTGEYREVTRYRNDETAAFPEDGYAACRLL